jgi:3-phenylpropionate/trans-cinnamate dioxygenase ferredoxin reductase subunit
MKPTQDSQIVIVGGGQAAAQCVDTLRKRGHQGRIVMVGDESLPPYQRPPLSKKFLAGALEPDRLLIRHASYYAEHGVELRLGFAATRIDRAARRVEIADGSHVAYDQLLIATGSLPRRLTLPGSELAGVHYLRTAADVDRLRGEIAPGRRGVIIGGGYIGLEVAATIAEGGVKVTVLEAADRVMNRVVSPQTSAFYQAEHAQRGVDIILGARINGVRPQLLANGARAGMERVGSVEFADGRQIPADFVLIAIGVAANEALARDAGLDCDNGIRVNEYCQTSDPFIYAAGDCARHPSIHYGLDVRLESVDNAFEQGASAALNMLGLTTVHDKVPWFWSDQFDLKMVIVGLASGFDDLVLRGDPASRSFSICYLKGGELIAVETVNQTKDQMAARKLVAARLRPDRAKLADPAVPLRDLT